MNKRKIILDCDPGHDDAIAIMLLGAFDMFDLLGISVVSGNQTVEKTAINAFNVTRYFNIDVPICMGASNPLKRERLNCGEIHGESGLDGFTFPDYQYDFSKLEVEDFLYQLLSKNEDVIFITTGPMTNLARLLIKYPDSKKHITQIILMGGAIKGGNLTPYAEFNILADAEAADICFKANIPMRMMGLDVTRKVLVLPDVLERARKLNTKGSDLFYKLMLFFNKTQKEVFGLEGGPLHDPATIVSLIDKDVFKFENMNVKIDVSNTDHYGQTICSINQEPKNVEVAVDVNVDKYWDIIMEVLKHYE